MLTNSHSGSFETGNDKFSFYTIFSWAGNNREKGTEYGEQHYSGTENTTIQKPETICAMPPFTWEETLCLTLKNNNKTYQFITAMQGIKLQDCEQRRRWEWEDVQAELFEANMKNLKLQQTQEAGSIFINEIKNRKRKDDHHQIAVGLLQGIGRRNLHRRHRSQPVQPKIDKERLAEAARIANINDYIMRLPLKYNTLIGQDGVGLSQGQKQRILIAQAVYKNPQYIFLDEATNALDAKNERTIVENLDQFYKGRTVVVVAHRLSTVKNAHQIIVLDKGRIVETGNHASLIEKKGGLLQSCKKPIRTG